MFFGSIVVSLGRLNRYLKKDLLWVVGFYACLFFWIRSLFDTLSWVVWLTENDYTKWTSMTHWVDLLYTIRG